MSKQANIVIIGSGVFGISTALHLAQQGYTHIKVFDKGDYDNNLFDPLEGASAASTDYNKLVRASYVDKTHYQNLALESLAKYYEWNQQLQKAAFLPKGLTNEDRVFTNTGYVRYDDIENGEEGKTLANFEKYGLRAYEYDINNPADLERAKVTGWYAKIDPLQQFGKVKTLQGSLDSLAGIANANKCLLWVRYLCERTGYVEFVYGNEKGDVKEIVYEGTKATGVKTADGKTYPADYVVVAAGGWTPEFIPSHPRKRFETEGSSWVMVQIPHDRQDLLDKYRNFPMINWRMSYEANLRADGVYMFPATDSGVIKIGANDHFWRYLAEKDGEKLSVPTSKYPLLPQESLETYKKFFREWLGDLADAGVKIEKSRICFTTLGQNNEFVVDWVPGKDNVIVSSGGGFHGFKFLPVIGRFAEGLISGKEYKYSELFKFSAIKESEYKDNIVDPSHKYALNSVEFVKQKQDYYNFKARL